MLIYVLHYVVLVASWAWFDRSRSSSCDGEGGVKNIKSIYIHTHDYTCPNRKQIYFEYLWVMWTFNSLIQKSHEKSVCVSKGCLFWGQRTMQRNCSPCSRFDAFAPEAKLEPIATCSLGCQAPTATRWFHAICVQSLNIFNAIAWYICFLPTFVLFVMSCYDHRPRVACPSRHFVPFLYIASIVLSSLRFGKDARPSEGCAVNDENHLERTTVDP